RACPAPALTRVKRTPEGTEIGTGTAEPVVVPFPSWPRLFPPQLHAVPSEVMPYVEPPSPELILTKGEPTAGPFTGDGTAMVVPTPSSPLELEPQAQTG